MLIETSPNEEVCQAMDRADTFTCTYVANTLNLFYKIIVLIIVFDHNFENHDFLFKD